MNSRQSLRRARINLAKALIQSYPEWIEVRHTLDQWIEGICTSKGPSDIGPVQGGLPVYEQERMMAIKESDSYYVSLCRDIRRMDDFLKGCNEDQRFIVEQFFWTGLPWWEICKVMSCTKSTLYDGIDAMCDKLADIWTNGEAASC